MFTIDTADPVKDARVAALMGLSLPDVLAMARGAWLHVPTPLLSAMHSVLEALPSAAVRFRDELPPAT
jgi:hypothetical protein